MKVLLGVVHAIFLFVLFIPEAHAGFGITPPYVRNASLIRNASYEQQILLVRSDPTVPLKADITIDVPGINDWFTIKEGPSFILPNGEDKVPMTVVVTVPDNAPYKTYTGSIRVKTGAPDGQVAGGAVSISLGAQIDVEITVIDKQIKDFRIRKIGLSDLNEGHKLGWLYFPGKMQFEMLVENIGNVKIAPSKVLFRVYDPSGQILLEESTHTNNIAKVKPFEQQSVLAELPTRLPKGAYLTRYQIWNGEDLKQEGDVSMNILPYGTLQVAGYGFMGLSLAHKLSVLVPVFVILASVAAILVRSTRRRVPQKTSVAPRRRRKVDTAL
ncbi:MAG: hypothetical protein RLZZ234_823 [Candidatus Parcubacteria bacterium]|jgi:hypothetical protein